MTLKQLLIEFPDFWDRAQLLGVESLQFSELFKKAFESRFRNYTLIEDDPFTGAYLDFTYAVGEVIENNLVLFNELYYYLITNEYLAGVSKQKSTNAKTTKVSDTPQSQVTSIDDGYLSSEMKESTTNVNEDQSVMSLASALMKNHVNFMDYVLKRFDSCFQLCYVIE